MNRPVETPSAVIECRHKAAEDVTVLQKEETSKMDLTDSATSGSPEELRDSGSYLPSASSTSIVEPSAACSDIRRNAKGWFELTSY